MVWIKVRDCNGGSIEKWANRIEWIDRTVLGRWMDGVPFSADGEWTFSEN